MAKRRKLGPVIARIVLIDDIAPRAGFTHSASGKWVRDWPSGNRWVLDQAGEFCYIEDKHGRIIRHSDRDPITPIGMLCEALRHH